MDITAMTKMDKIVNRCWIIQYETWAKIHNYEQETKYLRATHPRAYAWN